MMPATLTIHADLEALAPLAPVLRATERHTGDGWEPGACHPVCLARALYLSAVSPCPACGEVGLGYESFVRLPGHGVPGGPEQQKAFQHCPACGWVREVVRSE